MTVHVDHHADHVVVAISSDFDVRTAHEPYEAVAALLEAGDRPGLIVVDLTTVSFVDSTGLGGLVRLQHEATSYGVPVSLRGMGQRMRNLFAMTGLDQEFTIERV